MTAPFFSVVIPTCNRVESLKLCLDALAPGQQNNASCINANGTRSSDTEASYEVIVTNDGHPALLEKALSNHYPWVRLNYGPQKGPAANRNDGAASAQGTWLIFVDDDCIPQNDLIAQYKRHLDTHKNKAIEGAIHPQGDPDGDLVECPINVSGGYFWSANIAIEKMLFESVKGFDENFPSPALEDNDIYLRLKEHTDIAFESNAIVHHPIRKITFEEAFALARKRLASAAYYDTKHEKKLNKGGFFNKLSQHLNINTRLIAKRLLAGQIGWAVYFAYVLSIGTFYYGYHLKRWQLKK